jgi:ABC-type glutathione transport system ATPase component
MTAILALDDVSYAYRGTRSGQLAVQGVSFAIEAGQNTGLVGESGSGKSTLIKLLLGLMRPSTGRILFDGVPLDLGDRAQVRSFRRSVQTVFQDPWSSLDPRQRVGRIVSEPVRSLQIARGRAVDPLVAQALESVGLPADAASRYPHEFSGGQRQRIAIARAIVSRPRVLLADEPVSALDVITRTQVIALLAELGASRDLTVLMVSHDLGVVGALCQRTIVLQAGRIVEQGTTSRVLGAPGEPYTRQLLAAVPRLPQLQPGPGSDRDPRDPSAAQLAAGD